MCVASIIQGHLVSCCPNLLCVFPLCAFPLPLAQYYESLLEEVKDETKRDISEAVEKAITKKLQKQQTKLDKCMREKKLLDDVSFNIL